MNRKPMTTEETSATLASPVCNTIIIINVRNTYIARNSICNTYIPEKVSFFILEADGGTLEPELVLALGDVLVVVK